MNDKTLPYDLLKEVEDFTTAEIAAAERIYQDTIEQYKEAIKQDNTGTLGTFKQTSQKSHRIFQGRDAGWVCRFMTDGVNTKTR